MLATPDKRTEGDLSVSASAYVRIKRAIVTASILPGALLVESELMERFAIGRTPLREALHRLATDGLVVIFPRRGMVVAQLGLSEMRQLFEARMAIEAETTRLAAERISEAGRRAILAINLEVHSTEEPRSFDRFLEVDQRLHREISRLAHNKFLAVAADRILTLNEWIWHVHMARHGVTQSDFASHDAIIAALLAGDAESARSAMIDHIERSRGLLRVAI